MKLLASFKSKRVGFYLGLIGIILLLVASIIYTIGYASDPEVSKYYNFGALFVAIIASLGFIGLSLFKRTERFAVLPAWFLSLLSFLLFILGSYMYLSEVFYSGITEESLANLRIDYVVITIFYLLSCVILNVAVFNKQSKESNIKNAINNYDNGYMFKQATKKNKVVIFSSTFAILAVTAAAIAISVPNYVPRGSSGTVDTGLVITNPEINMDLGVSPIANIEASVSEGYVLSYKTQNPDIAIVDNTGRITAINKGTATIDVMSKLAGRPKALETKSVTLNIDAPNDFYQMKTGTQAKNSDVVANPGYWYLYTLTTSGNRIAYVANDEVNVIFEGVDANKEWYLRYQPNLPANANYVASMTIDISLDILARFAPDVVFQKLNKGTNTIKINRKVSSTTPFSFTLLANEDAEDATLNRKNYSGNFTLKITNMNFGQPLEFNAEEFAIDMNSAQKTAQIVVTDPSDPSATFTYESFDTSVATINNSGLITGVSEGSTKIKVTSSAGNKGEVVVRCSSHTVSLDKSSGFINVDELATDQLTATSDAPELITFTSSNTAIATVSNTGLVAGISRGVVTITAKCGFAEATCEYLVVKPSALPSEYNMEVATSAPSAKDAEVVKDPGIWHSFADGHSKLTSARYETVDNKGNIALTFSQALKTVYLRYQPCLPVGSSFTVRFKVIMPNDYVKSSSDVFQVGGIAKDIASGTNSYEVNATVSATKAFSIRLKLSVVGEISFSEIEVIA